jgi:uncharacterized protein (TIGR03118 family)
VCLAAASLSAQAIQVLQTNLVTDDQAANPAQKTDSALVNAWGISYSPTSPFWVSSNGNDLSTLYSVDPVTNATVKVPLEVSGPAGMTGQVYNGSSDFHGDRFLFVGEDGSMAGWRGGALGTTAETFKPASTDLYKGAAIATVTVAGTATTYLYAANFRTGNIDVLNGATLLPGALAGAFADPTLPAGYAPFNIQNLGGLLYVSYALQSGGNDEVQGVGLGIVNVFTADGLFLRRIASNGPLSPLNAPWGMAIAPASFREFAGDLLVGNFGDGLINVFSSSNDAFLGPLMSIAGTPVAIDGLWALIPGNDGSGGSSQAIYFSAGPNEESHGLFGVLAAVPEPGTIALLMLGLAAGYSSRRRRK